MASTSPVPHEERIAQLPSPAFGETATGTRPQSVTEALFNHGASFLGVPGLTAPLDLNRGADGSLDEGLGFHQDGTARGAGGVADSSRPSANGQRARAYMRTGLQNGYGMAGSDPGLYGASHDALWGRDDPTRGGRVSGSSGYIRELGDFDPMNMAIDRGLNYGAGLLNSAGEAALSGLVDGGRARLNFRLDKDGYFNGEGDALLPFYESTHTTAYTQLGARSMHDSDDTRWIGNFGLGQRWFPFAQGEDLKSADYDADILMLGYNAFFDYDFTRDHQRGGIGVETQYDWLRLSSNYYFPLSNWKGSEDFDSRFVKERAAEGWDARVKANLPFYRHIALTGAYSQWYGDHVGMFGASKLEKDPKVWSYGVEYTPIPLISGFITQKSTERGRSDAELGLNFTYHSQMPWEDQITPAKVTELRTVGGSRHEFVDRENRIILEYKAKNVYHIEYLGQSGSNVFRFRIRNGFDEFVSGQTVRVTASGVTLAAAPTPEQSFLARAGGAIADFFSVSTARAADFSQSYTTDGRGEFLVTVSSPASCPVSLIVQAGNSTQSFTLNVTNTAAISIDTTSPLPDATVGMAYSQPLTASGGTSPYSFAVISGSLPDGLSLSGNIISGSPSIEGVSTFTITVTDNSSATIDKQFSLTVGTAPVYGLAQTPPVSIAVGQAINSVAFVLTENGAAVADNTPVSLTYGGAGAFSSPPASATVSGGNGGFSLPLTGQTAGSVTVTVTFDGGKTATCTMTVSAARYTVSVVSSPASIRVFENTTFTATILKNSSAVPDGETVTWTVESGSGSFIDGTGASPTNRTSTANAGTSTITLQATDEGTVTVKAVIGGADNAANVTVTAPMYAISLSALDSNPGASGSSTLTATVTRNGLAAYGENVAFTWVVKGSSQSSQSGTTGSTDSNGETTYMLTGNGDHKTIEVTATLQSDMSKTATVDVQFGGVLPNGFIALASETMDWDAASSYCASQGGQLPENKDYPYSGVTLPDGLYWSRQKSASSSAYILSGGPYRLATFGPALRSFQVQVVCVP